MLERPVSKQTRGLRMIRQEKTNVYKPYKMLVLRFLSSILKSYAPGIFLAHVSFI